VHPENSRFQQTLKLVLLERPVAGMSVRSLNEGRPGSSSAAAGGATQLFTIAERAAIGRAE
jgi:hypothetical protein